MARRARARRVDDAGGGGDVAVERIRIQSQGRQDADHFFTGFPSYWNVVVFYLLVAGWSSCVNAAVLLMFVVLVFVPIRYVYPSRTPILQLFTNVVRLRSGRR